MTTVRQTPLSLGRVQQILDMRLGRMRIDAHRTSVMVPVLRAILLAIHRHEGVPMLEIELADYAQVCKPSTNKAIRTLRRMGLIERGLKEGGQRFRYRINGAALAAACDPLRRLEAA